MPNPKLDLQKHTLNLFNGDFDRLKALHPDLDGGAVIRQLVRDYIDKIEANAPTQPATLLNVETSNGNG